MLAVAALAGAMANGGDIVACGRLARAIAVDRERPTAERRRCLCCKRRGPDVASAV